MDTPPPLPVALGQLVAALETQGFDVVERGYDAQSFGNQLIELAGPTDLPATAVRLVRDRGLWSVEVQLDGGDWFGPYELTLAIENGRYSTRALSHVESRDLTLDAIARLPRSRSSIHQVYERLLGFRREYNRQFTRELDSG